MYLIVSKGKLVESEEPMRNEEYFLVDETTNHIYSLNLYDIQKVNDTKVDIGLRRIDLNNLRLCRQEDLTEILNSERPQMVTKDAERKMLNPYENNFRPFTRAVLIAVQKHKNRRALKRDDYDKILGLIREFNKLADGSKDVSVKKAEELLYYYNLSITDIIREEFL